MGFVAGLLHICYFIRCLLIFSELFSLDKVIKFDNF